MFRNSENPQDLPARVEVAVKTGALPLSRIRRLNLVLAGRRRNAALYRQSKIDVYGPRSRSDLP